MSKISSELNKKTIDELEKEAQSLRDEITKLKLSTKINPIKDTNLIFKKRKRLAVVLTLINQKNQK